MQMELTKWAMRFAEPWSCIGVDHAQNLLVLVREFIVRDMFESKFATVRYVNSAFLVEPGACAHLIVAWASGNVL